MSGTVDTIGRIDAPGAVELTTLPGGPIDTTPMCIPENYAPCRTTTTVGVPPLPATGGSGNVAAIGASFVISGCVIIAAVRRRAVRR